jgi:hypothetical protein
MVELSTAESIADRSVPVLDLSVEGLLRSAAAARPDAAALVVDIIDGAQRAGLTSGWSGPKGATLYFLRGNSVRRPLDRGSLGVTKVERRTL